MIKTFVHKGLEKFFRTGSTAGIQAMHARRLQTLLIRLDEAKIAQDMALPGFKLHPLKGDKQGLWSVSVNRNWRMTFRFEESNAYVLNYIDYH